MPAKKNQSMRSKSTTSYKKGGSMKNQKVHPLKYFIDQNQKRIVKAQTGFEVTPNHEATHSSITPKQPKKIKKENSYFTTPTEVRAKINPKSKPKKKSYNSKSKSKSMWKSIKKRM